MNRERRMYGIWAVLVIAGGVISFVEGGVPGLAGWLVGVGASAFNLWAMWMAIRLLGTLFAKNPATHKGGPILVLAFLIKLPVFVVAGMSAQRLGSTASTAFIVAIGLVYSLMVWWASSRS